MTRPAEDETSLDVTKESVGTLSMEAVGLADIKLSWEAEDENASDAEGMVGDAEGMLLSVEGKIPDEEDVKEATLLLGSGDDEAGKSETEDDVALTPERTGDDGAGDGL